MVLKSIILSILLLSSYCCIGQERWQVIDSIFKVMKDSNLSTMSVGNTTYFDPPDSIIHWWTPEEQVAYKKRYKAIKSGRTLLLRDTTINGYTNDTTKVFLLVSDKEEFEYSVISSTWVMIGYIVRNDWCNLKYLDINKKPIPENIIVWQVVEETKH